MWWRTCLIIKLRRTTITTTLTNRSARQITVFNQGFQTNNCLNVFRISAWCSFIIHFRWYPTFCRMQSPQNALQKVWGYPMKHSRKKITTKYHMESLQAVEKYIRSFLEQGHSYLPRLQKIALDTLLLISWK